MYKLLLLAGDNITWKESSFCEHTDPLLVQDLYCYIPMEDLTTTFSLPYNKFISAKIQAYNLRGWGDLSPTNTESSYVEVVPE